jgi:hypothetical protein
MVEIPGGSIPAGELHIDAGVFGGCGAISGTGEYLWGFYDQCDGAGEEDYGVIKNSMDRHGLNGRIE